MTGRDDFVLSLACRAYQEKPFYRWFYDNVGLDVERATVQDLPYLTKHDLFRFAEESGQPHYWPLLYAESELLHRTTSGTTGRPLPVPWLKAEWFFACNSIFLNFISQIKGRPRFLMAVSSSEEEEQAAAFGSVIVGAARHRLADAAYVLELIRSQRPNVLVDNSPGIWFGYLLDHGLDPRQAGIQLVLGLPNARVAQQAESLGIRYVSIFGCTEAGLFGYSHSGLGETYHLSDAGSSGIPGASDASRLGLLGGIKVQVLTQLFPCDCYSGVDLERLIGTRDVRVQLNDGCLETTGSGRMVLTCANSAFPFVKYLNGDVVEIFHTAHCACGFAGRTLKFQHREHEVQVPYAGLQGTVIRLEWIVQHLEQKGFRRVLPVYYPIDEVLRIVVTFLEDEGVDAPRADYQPAPGILSAACSIDLEIARNASRDLLFYPTIRVPPGMIPLRDGVSLKSRLFLDAVNGRVPDEYQSLLALAETLLDKAPIFSAGSWFPMSPATAPRLEEA